MKFMKIFASMFLVFMVCSAFSLKGNKKDMGMYMVGVSASFTDSLIYFTDIQHLDSVSLDKAKLLPLRGQYSDQLKDYLTNNLGLKDRTCFIYFDAKKSKLEKVLTEYEKFRVIQDREILSDFDHQLKTLFE